MPVRFGQPALAFAAAAAVASVISAASAQTPGPLRRLTYTSIFSTCAADHVAYQERKLDAIDFANSAVEPQLSINPADTSQLLIGVQQDRWNNGGSRGLRGETSGDGGMTWKPSSTPGVTLCQGGPWQRSSDPWVAFSADGKTAYMSALTVDESTNPNALAKTSGQTVSASHDGGHTWGLPVTLIIDNDINILNDKNSLTADALNPNFAYVVWDRLQQFVAGAGVADEGENAGDSDGAAQVAPGRHDGMDIAHAIMNHARAVRAGTAGSVKIPVLVRGPSLFSRTTDAGLNWSTPTVAHDPGANSQTIANQIVTLANGDIADFFTELQDNTAGQPTRVGYVVSNNHGTTWSPASYAQEIINQQALTPNLRQPIRSADVLFSVAVDLTNNITYLVWEDERFSGDNEVAFAWSPDFGFEWTAPVRINQTPRSPAGPLFQQALIPTVAVAADGTVGVTYYDFRNDTPGAKTDATDYWMITCNTLTSPDNCLGTGDWSNEVRMTEHSFDFNVAPLTTSGRFVGDYMALRTVGQTFYSVFGQSPDDGISAQYFRTVTIPSVVAAK